MIPWARFMFSALNSNGIYVEVIYHSKDFCLRSTLGLLCTVSRCCGELSNYLHPPESHHVPRRETPTSSAKWWK
jgi:hypothetical protein